MNNIKIEIITGKLVEQDVEALVCSANNWLQLGTGSAEEIKKAAGPEIQQACDELIINHHHQPFAIGTAVLTSAGKLTDEKGNKKYIIHAIAMGYEQKELIPQNRILATPETVAKAVTSVLALANKQHISSIAFPLLCARPGYSTVEPEKAYKVMLDAMVKAIKNFEEQNQTIARISICVNDSDFLPGGICNRTHNVSSS